MRFMERPSYRWNERRSFTENFRENLPTLYIGEGEAMTFGDLLGVMNVQEGSQTQPRLTGSCGRLYSNCRGPKDEDGIQLASRGKVSRILREYEKSKGGVGKLNMLFGGGPKSGKFTQQEGHGQGRIEKGLEL